MAKVRTREEALLNAYLNRYQNAQASTVSSGQSAQQNAQSKGSALMNSTDKSLPEVKDYSSDIYNGIISSAKQDNELTTAAMKQYQKEQEAAAKEAEKAAKAAAKSSKKTGGSKKSGSKSGSTTGSESDDTDVSAAVNALLGGNTETAGTETKSGTSEKSVVTAKSGAAAQAERNASARAKYSGSTQQKKDTEDSKKLAAAREKDAEYIRNQKIKRMLNEKKNGSPGKAGTSYAERQNAAQGAQSRAVTSTGQQVGSSYAAAGQAPTESERTAGAKIKQQTADALKKLQNDKDYLAELAKPGRKLTQSEIQAVKQYGKNANDLYKEYQNGDISIAEYNQQAQNLTRLNQKASMNGLGQDMQAFTSGLMTSAPFLQQTDNAVKSLGGDTYRKAIEDGVIPDTLNALQGYQDQNKLAAAAGTMAGKSAQYATFNNLMEGTPLADTMGKVGGKVMGAASSIPVLGRFATPAAGEALGRILTDQTADTALDTIPSLINDLSTYDEQQGRIKSGEQVDDALTPGRIGLNVLGNVGQNFAMNALPEIGGAVVNGIKNSRTAQRMLDEQAQALADGTLQNDAAMLLRSGDLTQSENLPVDNAAWLVQNEVTGGIANGTTDLGGTVPADISVLSDSGKRFEPQPGENGIGISGAAGTGGEAAGAAGDGARAAADGAADSTSLAGWASAVTGKGRRSQLTRRVEALGERIANGESRESLLQEANDIAARLVKESDFAEPADEATLVLRDYLKNTPIRLDEQAAGDILYSSGLKSLSQYNIHNGTNFSTTKGLDFDAALQELNGMNVGLNGDDGVNALMDAVAKSKEKPVVDTVYASAYTDYVRDYLLDGVQKEGLSDEGFMDWLDAQSFDRDAPDYVQQMNARINDYAPWDDADTGIPVLNQTDNAADVQSVPALERQAAESTARPLNGSESVPENAIGAKKAGYTTDKIVENRDYANQAASRTVLDDAHREGLTDNTHRVWTDTEAQQQALNDISTYIQSAGGNVDKGLDNAMSDLKKEKLWDKGQSVTANNIRDRLRTEYMKTEPGTPEFYRQRARYDDWVGEISSKRSATAQTMQSFTGDAKARVYEVSGPIREKWETEHTSDKAKIERLSRELEKLKQDNADFVAGKIEPEKFISDIKNPGKQSAGAAADTAGAMDDEFAAMLKEQGVQSIEERVAGMKPEEQAAYKTQTDKAFDGITARVKKLAEKNHVKMDDDQAKVIAGKVMNGDSAESYYESLITHAAGISELSIDEMEMVDDLYSKAATLPDGKERYELEQTAINIMAQHLPAKSWFERFDNVRYLAMLGNPTTHARNLIGNTMMTGMTGAKDEVAAAMQLVLPKEARTKALYTPKEMLDAADNYINTEAYTKVLKDGGRYNLDQGVDRARSTYGKSIFGRALQKASDVNSNLLDKEDEIYLALGAKRSLASNLTAKGYDASIFTKTDDKSREIVAAALEQAIQDAKDMTFHADNALTKNLSKISNLGDKNGSIGDKLFYMMGNGLLPFAKTPGNILKTAGEYNLVGGAAEAIYRAANHKGAAAVTDALAKGVVGTGLMGLGWWLAREGLITGSLGESEDYDKMLGKQAYSLNIPGKGSYSIDWAAPAVVPIFMGANLVDTGLDLRAFLKDPEKYAGQVADILTNALDPVTQMSLLSSVNDTLESLKYDNGTTPTGTLLASLGTNYVRQFVPTVLSKAARTIDPVRRSSYGGGDTPTERNATYLLRSTENKIPGLSQSNEPYIDQWGRSTENLDGTDGSAEGIAKRALYNFASPGYISQENVTPTDEYLQSLYGATNDLNVLPKKASSSLTVDKSTYYLTPQEKTEYARTSGQTAYNIVDELRQNEMFLQLPEEQQAELVQKGYSVAKTVGGVAAVGGGVSGTDSKEYKAYEDGGTDGLINYMLAKNAVDVAKNEAEAAHAGDDEYTFSKAERWEAVSSTLSGDAAATAYVEQSGKDSVERRIYNASGETGVSAYMNAYSKISAGLKENEEPSQKQMTAALLKSGLSDTDLAKTYFSVYPKDEKGAAMYAKYGTSGLKTWLAYITVADADGNGSVNQTEAKNALNAMDLTEELKRAYWQNTNKSWKENKNPY